MQSYLTSGKYLITWRTNLSASLYLFSRSSADINTTDAFSMKKSLKRLAIHSFNSSICGFSIFWYIIIRSMSRGTQKIFHKKCLFIITEYVSNRLLRLAFSAVKNISLNNPKYSFFMEIEKPELSFWISITHDSSSESTCFLIAGKVHQISLSNALMETHCLRKTKYLRISTLVLLQNSFSKFIVEIEINFD